MLINVRHVATIRTYAGWFLKTFCDDGILMTVDIRIAGITYINYDTCSHAAYVVSLKQIGCWVSIMLQTNKTGGIF